MCIVNLKNRMYEKKNLVDGLDSSQKNKVMISKEDHLKFLRFWTARWEKNKELEMQAV